MRRKTTMQYNRNYSRKIKRSVRSNTGEPPGFRTLNLLIKSVSKMVQSISFSYKSAYLCLLYKTDFIRKSSVSQNQYGYTRELLVSFFSPSIYS